MAKRKQARPSRSARSSKGTRQMRTPIANGSATPTRTISKPPLTERFHVAVDRQLKSGYETYEAAEKAALAIKRRYPKLYVTVFDAREHRHAPIVQQGGLAGAANKNGLAEQATRNAVGRHKAAVTGGKH